MSPLHCVLALGLLAAADSPTPRIEDATPQEHAAGAVILELEHSVSMDELGTTVDVRESILVLNERGLAYAQIELLSYPNNRVTSVRAETVLPGGRAVELPQERILTAKAFSGMLAPTTERKILAFPNVTVGSVLQLQYRRRQQEITSFGAFYADFALPARKVTVNISTRFGEDARQTLVTETRGFTRQDAGMGRTWVARDVVLPSEEAFAPAGRELAPYVRYRLVPLWKSTAAVGPALAAYVWERVEGFAGLAVLSGPPRAVVEAIWTAVQERIYDRAPMPTKETRSLQEVLQSRAGDATERALVMLSSLRRAKIRAALLFLPGPETPDLDDAFATPEGLSEVVVYVQLEGQEILLDPECLGCAAGELSFARQGRRGLLVALPLQAELDDGGRDGNFASWSAPYTTPVSRDGGAKLETVLEVTPRGLVMRDGTWTIGGAGAADLRRQIALHTTTPDARARYLREAYFEVGADGTVHVDGLNVLGGPITAKLEGVLFAVGGYVLDGDWFVLPVNALRSMEWTEALSPTRELPADFRKPPAMNHLHEIVAPEGYAIDSVPAPVTLESEVGSYALTATAGEGKVVLGESLRLARHRYAGADYQKLVEFLGAVTAHRRQEVRMRRATKGR